MASTPTPTPTVSPPGNPPPSWAKSDASRIILMRGSLYPSFLEGAAKEEEEKIGEKEGKKWRSDDVPDLKMGWSLPMEGLVISAVYWGWILSAAVADRLVRRAGAGVVLAGSVGGVGVAGLAAHGVSVGGPWALLALRIVQGAFQGFAYPSVRRVLEGVPVGVRAYVGLLVYSGPYLGTGFGAGLGGTSRWYVAHYAAGAMAVALAPFCLLLPQRDGDGDGDDAAARKAFLCGGGVGGVLRSAPARACAGVHAANAWFLHTLLVGVPQRLHALGRPQAGGCGAAAVALAAGVASRVPAFVAQRLGDCGLLNALDRRRLPVLSGSLLVVICAVLLSFVVGGGGRSSPWAVVGVAAGVGGVGVGVARAGYGLNVSEMAPLSPWRVLNVLGTAGMAAAAISPVVLTSMAKMGEGGWMGVWVVPLTAVVPSAVVYLFLLTTNPEPFDDERLAVPNGAIGGTAGGCVAPEGRMSLRSGQSFGTARSTQSFGTAKSTQSFGTAKSTQSFGTARSTHSFGTAASRSGSRTVSCRTADDGLDGDMHSVGGGTTTATSAADWRSFDDDDDDDTGRVRGERPCPPEQLFGSVLCNGTAPDRTAAWLSSHHSFVQEEERPLPAPGKPPSKGESLRRNAIHGLLW